MIEFDNPSAFLLLLLIPILYFLRYLKLLSRLSLPLTLSNWNGENYKWKSRGRSLVSFISRLCAVLSYVFMVMALASPVTHEQQKIYSTKGSAIVFVIAVSPSMSARDIGDLSRIESAKNAIRYLAEANGGAELGLVEMAESAAIIVPPTMDRVHFYDRLNSICAGELGDGTAIGTGLSCAVYHLASSTSPKKSIVLITDGENNAGTIHPHTAARLTKEKGISLYVLGIGTRGMVPIEYADPKTGKVYSGYLESNFDDTSLTQIAMEANGKYYGAESTQALFQSMSTIGTDENVIQSYHIKNKDSFKYEKFVAIALMLFFLFWVLRRLVLMEVL